MKIWNYEQQKDEEAKKFLPKSKILETRGWMPPKDGAMTLGYYGQ